MIRTAVLALAPSFAGMLSVSRSEEASPPWNVFADFEGETTNIHTEDAPLPAKQ